MVEEDFQPLRSEVLPLGATSAGKPALSIYRCQKAHTVLRYIDDKESDLKMIRFIRTVCVCALTLE